MNEAIGPFRETQATFTIDEGEKPSPKIVVIGIGGAGGNSIRRMVELGFEGIELIAADTDAQALRNSRAPLKFEIGAKLARNLGCKGDPQLGQQAALEETERILDLIEGADIVFIAGGEGGGTFTGAAPIFASLASASGALTIATVIMPFSFQGTMLRTYAEDGLRELEESLDAVIVVPNETLLRTLDANTSLEDSLRFIDDILCQAIQNIAEIIAKPGIIKLNLADVRTVLQHRGAILWGSGIAEGPNRAVEAAERAITNPLGEEMPIKEAKAALINIAGSKCCLRLHETENAAEIIKKKSGLENILIGARYDDSLGERLKVTLIAAGFRQEAFQQFAGSGRSAGAEAVVVKPPSRYISVCGSYRPSNWEELDRPPFQRRRAVGANALGFPMMSRGSRTTGVVSSRKATAQATSYEKKNC